MFIPHFLLLLLLLVWEREDELSVPSVEAVPFEEAEPPVEEDLVLLLEADFSEEAEDWLEGVEEADWDGVSICV